ncbi:ribosomal protein S18 acetylase RimI-like enzyme [Microbacterium marinum]|uniref:Ribosomal protein S18 acetylase RimI-like enzyme n=1 Tax=Microbacterium marinum TaxID=421115 RepID=A0A7W7BP85_9MICO|nr:GNAT family N-acetyltransferase [Microbacterium marinum]MBB4665371.1 ribosomal protein S18 acetylase RimI-like enzyme [Microbacterium marinum]
MALTIRTPSSADATALADLHVQTWRETYTHLLPEGYFDEAFIRGRHEMWARLTGDAREDLTVRLAEVDGVLVGLAMSGPPQGDDPPRDRQLYFIYVAASAHGTGAGQALLEAVLGDAPALLWVAKQNPRAIAFYRRNGFAFDGVEQLDPGAPAITDLRMVR